MPKLHQGLDERTRLEVTNKMSAKESQARKHPIPYHEDEIPLIQDMEGMFTYPTVPPYNHKVSQSTTLRSRRKRTYQLDYRNQLVPFHFVSAGFENILMQTSGSSPESSTGILATRSIQSWMASVMWGTTWTVFPR